MSVFITLFIVCLIYFLILVFSDYDFIQPASIICIMCILSLLVCLLFVDKLKIELKFETIAVFLLAVFSFAIPAFLHPNKTSEIKEINSEKFYSKKIILFSLLFVILATILYFFQVKKVATALGYGGGSKYRMLFYYRNATLHNSNNVMQYQSKWIGQFVVANFAVAYLMLIDFIKRIIYKKAKDKFSLVCHVFICLIYIIQSILSGGRTQFLYYMESFLFLLLFFSYKRNNGIIHFQIIKRLFVIIIVVGISFYALGSLTGKTHIFNFTGTLFVYFGSPVAAFDKMNRGIVEFSRLYPGCNIFYGFADSLNKLGFNISSANMTAPFVNIGSLSTNIYGSFARYYFDFGLVGVFIFPLLIGSIFQYVYCNLQSSENHLYLKLTIFLLCSQVMFDYCIEERFFLSVLSLSTVLRIVYIFVFYKLFEMKILM